MMEAANKQKGQTLIEMVIAVGLVAFVLVGLVAGAIVSLQTARLARERNVANQLVATELENARQERDADPISFFADTGVTGPTTVGENPAFQVTVTKTLDVDQMEILVEVSWDDSGKTFHVEQSTYLTRWR